MINSLNLEILPKCKLRHSSSSSCVCLNFLQTPPQLMPLHRQYATLVKSKLTSLSLYQNHDAKCTSTNLTCCIVSCLVYPFLNRVKVVMKY